MKQNKYFNQFATLNSSDIFIFKLSRYLIPATFCLKVISLKSNFLFKNFAIFDTFSSFKVSVSLLYLPILFDNIFLLSYVHQLNCNTALHLRLLHQPIHDDIFTELFLLKYIFMTVKHFENLISIFKFLDALKISSL